MGPDRVAGGVDRQRHGCSVMRHDGRVDRHELLVSLARPYANEDLQFAEIYRVPVRFDRGARAAVVVMGLVVVAVAFITRSYAVANRVVIALLAGAVYGAVMIRRRFRGRPNLVRTGSEQTKRTIIVGVTSWASRTTDQSTSFITIVSPIAMKPRRA
jgi:FlaA1/EpsC-like NDP-sugar epimerase